MMQNSKQQNTSIRGNKDNRVVQRRSAAFWLSVTCALLPVLAQAQTRPNIVIIYADDMGYGDLAIQNPDSKIPTPNLDRLAREGIRFTDAHSSSGICTPSRYALLTGRYHWRKFHGIVNSWGESVFESKRLTLPELLQAEGYHTACIGKWHLGFDWSAIRKENLKARKKDRNTAEGFDWSKPIPDGPLNHGFDYYFGDDVPNFPPYAWIENDRVIEPPTVPYEPDPKPTEGSPEGRPGPMVTGWKQDAVMPKLTQKTVEWIAQQKGSDKPFFLYWSWTSPHAPIVPTAQWQGKTNAGGYGDFVAQSDHHAGEVLRALDENGFRDNTILIFTADNGPEKYAYERVRKFNHRSTGPLRGLKRDIWEGGHRVPFLVRWPSKVPAGIVSDGLVSQVDIMATLASIVGAELPSDAADDSHDQFGLWKGGDSSRSSIVHNTFKGRYAIREGHWLLIDAPNGTHSKVPDWYATRQGYVEHEQRGVLIDLQADMGQKQNLFADYPKKVKALRRLLATKQASGEVRPQ